MPMSTPVFPCALKAAAARPRSDPRARLLAHVTASFARRDRRPCPARDLDRLLEPGEIKIPQVARLHGDFVCRLRANWQTCSQPAAFPNPNAALPPIAITALVDGLWLEL